jgi:hypothetical protein
LREMVDREMLTSLAASPVVRNSVEVMPFSFDGKSEIWRSRPICFSLE